MSGAMLCLHRATSSLSQRSMIETDPRNCLSNLVAHNRNSLGISQNQSLVLADLDFQEPLAVPWREQSKWFRSGLGRHRWCEWLRARLPSCTGSPPQDPLFLAPAQEPTCHSIYCSIGTEEACIAETCRHYAAGQYIKYTWQNCHKTRVDMKDLQIYKKCKK